jgi:hypothetical protein
MIYNEEGAEYIDSPEVAHQKCTVGRKCPPAEDEEGAAHGAEHAEPSWDGQDADGLEWSIDQRWSHRGQDVLDCVMCVCVDRLIGHSQIGPW